MFSDEAGIADLDKIISRRPSTRGEYNIRNQLVWIGAGDTPSIDCADVGIAVDVVAKLDAGQRVYIRAAAILGRRSTLATVRIGNHQVASVRGLRALNAQTGLQMDPAAKFKCIHHVTGSHPFLKVVVCGIGGLVSCSHIKGKRPGLAAR